MSRIVVFGTDQKAAGEISAMFNRGWMLDGHPAVSGGGSTTLSMGGEDAAKSFLQFGRMVLVSHAKLPSWAGMIDPPWSAALPVSVAVYNAEYLLSLRSPDEPVTITGAVGSIVAKMLEMFNAVEDLYVRIGDTSKADQTYREELLDGRTYWEQLSALLLRSGCEMLPRAEKDANGRLIIYLDIATRIGLDTGFLYSDGAGGNASFASPVVDGLIVNRVIGTGDESGQVSRMRTAPFINEPSKQMYRTRSQTVQWRDVREQGTLERYTENYLRYSASPKFTFLMNIMDQGDAFLHARLGNLAIVHFANGYFPGGVRGFRGTARIVAMAFTESTNLLTAKMEVMTHGF